VTVTVQATAENLSRVNIYIDGVLGFEYDSGFHVFHPPEVRGTATTSNTLIVVTLRRRRHFSPGTPIVVRVVSTGTVTPETVYETRFFSMLPASSLRDQSLRDMRVDASFPASCHSLEIYRRSLLGAFGQGNGSFQVALVHRVKRCQLVSLLPAQQATVHEAIDVLLPTEVAAVDEVDAVVTGFAFLWPRAQEELLALSVAPETVEVVARSHDAMYPQERVGAVCLALLLAVEALSV
jgi:hypothetical protein